MAIFNSYVSLPEGIICFPISQQIQEGKELTTKRQTFHSEDLWLSGLPSLVNTCAYNVVPPPVINCFISPSTIDIS